MRVIKVLSSLIVLVVALTADVGPHHIRSQRLLVGQVVMEIEVERRTFLPTVRTAECVYVVNIQLGETVCGAYIALTVEPGLEDVVRV